MAPMALNDTNDAVESDFHKVESPTATIQLGSFPNKKQDPSQSSTDADTKEKSSTPDATDEKDNFKFIHLYRYATASDRVLLLFGLIAASANGALFPTMSVIFGDVINGFASVPIDMDKINNAALTFFFIAVGMFCTDYTAYIAFHYSAERQMQRLRTQALTHMLHMDISWYDTNDALQLSSRLTGDTVKIKEGMGVKLGDALRYMSQLIVGFVIGFVKGWDITLVMMTLMPVMAISLGWLMKSLRKKSDWAQKVYAEAGAIAEDTLGSMRTVASLNAEPQAIAAYETKTFNAERENIALYKMVSAVFAMFFGSMWLMYCIGLWYGGNKVANDKSDPGTVFSAFFSVLMGTMALGLIQPNISAVSQASGAAQALFKILDTPSAIDASSSSGIIPDSCHGAIEAININFAYPSRPDAMILNNYSVKIEAGQTVAFAGSSGGGKSTLVALLERFYDPTSGVLLLDGRDVKTLNVKWLRSQIGLVSQEPVLFATSIFANIAAGGFEITRQQAIEAAKLANAHTFIMSLPEGYDTVVGEKGVSLSGGQKQRVAIARAIVRQPKILVLDEATSALDNESERIVQMTLNNLMRQTRMTTLVIAHRLSTIRHADKIVVLQGGHIVESGSHDDLVQYPDGIYASMYQTQQLTSIDDEEASPNDHSDLDASNLAHRSSFVSTQSDGKSEFLVEQNGLELPSFGFRDLFRFSEPERKHLIIGLIGCVYVGTAMPASGVLISGIITSMTNQYALFKQTNDRSHLDKLYDDVQTYGFIYLGGAFVLMAFTYMQWFCFKYIAEKLTTRLRNVNFASLARQNIGFFDETKNATGALTADLATNATKVALLSGDSQARMFQAMFTMVAAVIISFGFGSWQLTLVLLAIFPFLVYGHMTRMKELHSKGAVSDELAESGAHASECLSNIRTVVSLGLETRSTDTYTELLQVPMKKGTKEAQINAIAQGFSSSILMATYALVFYLGGQLVNNGTITFSHLMRTLMAIMMSVQSVTGAASYFGDTQTSFKSGSNIIALRDRQLTIDSLDTRGLKPAKVNGRLEFRDVHFRYPTRPEMSVLKHYNLSIEAGQTVAFCGPSGGGKSTIISLIERFYDPIKGDVLLDGHNIKDLNVSWLRSQIGLVGQEPTLFVGTISENIAYGLPTVPSQNEIEAAAKMANAHDFISQFPDGYATLVGLKGDQLSGGQKQRIAIARAILKNPSILLLDEATSALDSESEKVVQEALDKVLSSQRRTTIVIAHRLSTIRKADKICVVSGGRIAEQGTHAELINLNGLYANLVACAS